MSLSPLSIVSAVSKVNLYSAYSKNKKSLMRFGVAVPITIIKLQLTFIL